jgi:hypothetical protein
MEEWFHNSNNKVEVDNAKPLIGEYYRPYKFFSQERKRQMVTAYPKCME